MEAHVYVYILKCSDGTYYTGVTNDVHRRFNEHESGCSMYSYTASRRPLKLIYSQFFPTPFEAIAAEKQIKKWSKRKKEALIHDNWEELKRLAKKDWKK